MNPRIGVTAPVGETMDRFAAILLAMLVAAPASAQVMVDGPHLQETCSNPDEVRRAACAGFIGATVDALAPLHEFCIPPVTPPEIIERTVDFLRSSASQIASYPGVEQVKLALKAIWPCTTSQPGVGVTINPAAGPSFYFGLDPHGRPVAKIR
jgi:Rap1a immunity proteins